MKYLIALVLALVSIGCGTSITPPQPYVQADRLTKKAAENYLGITKTDHPELKPAIDDVLDSWERRVKNAEQGVWPQ